MIKISAEKLNKELKDYFIHRECVRRSCKYLAEYLMQHGRGAEGVTLMSRADVHDISKIRHLNEFLALASISDNIENMSDQAHELTDEERKALQIHWDNNPHHAEYHDNPNDMSNSDSNELTSDVHARSKQFKNPSCVGYIESQQDIRWHFDKDHYRRVHTYASLLDDITEDDDYSDIINQDFNLSFKFNDKTIANLEKFNIDPFSNNDVIFEDYIMTDRLYLRRNDQTDFAMISYEIHLKEVNTLIGYINIRCDGEVEFKINTNFRGKAFGEEALVALLSRSQMDYLYTKVRSDNVSAIKLLRCLGFDDEPTKDESTIKFSTKSLDRLKELRRTP